MTTIYALIDPRDDTVRYVGKAAGCPNRRRDRHISDAKRGDTASTHIGRWLMKLIAAGVTPEVKCLETVEDDAWQEAERRWIAHYRRKGARLTNATDGGDGVIGYKATPEVRAKISAAKLGHAVSAETRAKIAIAGRGRKHSKDTKAKMSAMRRGRPGRPVKLTPQIVRSIRQSKLSVTATARQKQLSPSTVSDIRNRRSWTHVPD